MVYFTAGAANIEAVKHYRRRERDLRYGWSMPTGDGISSRGIFVSRVSSEKATT